MTRRRDNKPNTKFENLPFANKYSMKNIPIPKENEYRKKLIAQMEKIIKRMRWKALFFLKGEDKYKPVAEEVEFYEKEETYGFKTEKKPPPIKEMEAFEKDFYEIARNIKFREDDKYGKFQNELNKDLAKMKKSKSVIIAADKSRNFYTCDAQTYRDLRANNVEEEYTKSTIEEVEKVDKITKEMAESLKLENRMQKYTKTECFITLKDHKENFITRPKCRLINTAKNDLGRVVKIKVEKINREIRYKTGVNQWQSTQNALEWFNKIKDPKSYTFVKFDIVSFYPSINPSLIKNAIQFAKSIDGIVIPEADEKMILQCRKSFLFCDHQPWAKTGQENFDVPMGSYDGAEICELVGLYLLHMLTSGEDPIFEIEKVGLYRDDGLAVIKLNRGGRDMEKEIKPRLNAVFNNEGLKITIEPASQVTDYLDVKFNLDRHTHEPYQKPSSYLNVQSNHPRHIIKHIPEMIEQRLSTLSSTEEIFENSKTIYEKALRDSGYKCELKYQKPVKSKKRKRSRNVMYFNPPFSRSVNTNVIKQFLQLIDKHFPKEHKLHKCFNRNTVKATYCTLTNMKEKIGIHNAKILSTENTAKEKKKCNCQTRNKENCPIPGECDQKNVVYQADVHGDNKIMKYFGSTEDFKKRWYAHKASFNKRPANPTTLSSYVWMLKDRNITPKVVWSIKARGHAFSSGSQSCDLCLTEKLVILTANPHTMLNKRDELLETCRHRRKHLLVSIKQPTIDNG